jgi:hypothetical protein
LVEENDMMDRVAIAAAMIALLGSAGIAFAQSSASKVVLITAKEAELPAAGAAAGAPGLTFRAGVTRAPKVTLVAPAASNATVKSPLHLQLKFESFGGAKIDPGSVKVTYMKDPPVDLTERLKVATQASGIDLDAAEVPAGMHDIRVDVKDADGRTGTATFTLKVAQ